MLTFAVYVNCLEIVDNIFHHIINKKIYLNYHIVSQLTHRSLYYFL